MIIVLPFYYLECEKVTNLYYTSEDAVTTKSNVVWHDPRTWDNPPTVDKQTKHRMAIHFISRGIGQIHHLTYANSQEVVNAIKEIVRQLKEQSNATDREMLDKVFETALAEAK
jgi:hypothetical protein